MNNYNSSPFEKLERLGKAAAKPVKRAVGDAFTDALQSLTGNYGDKQAPQADQATQALQADERKRLQEARTRLAQINKEIIEARKKREQADQAPLRQGFEGQAKQEKKGFEKKKKESVLSKLIKSRQGSKEAMQRASG